MRKNLKLKSDDDIRKMRVAGLLTAKALKEVRAAVRPGITTLELDAIAALPELLFVDKHSVAGRNLR